MQSIVLFVTFFQWSILQGATVRPSDEERGRAWGCAPLHPCTPHLSIMLAAPATASAGQAAVQAKALIKIKA